MVSNLTQRRREVARSEILTTAELLFIEHGLRNTSMAQIGEAVGLGRAALYYYFPSKDDLVRATVEVVASRFSLLQDIEAETPFPDAVGMVFDALVEAVAGSATDLRFLMSAILEQLDEAPGDQMVGSTVALFRDGLTELLERGQNQGLVLRSVDPEAFAGLLVSSILGIELMSLLDPGFDFASAARRVEETFLHQVCTAKGTKRRHAM